MKKLLSASEIAALKLPGLPTTKVAISAMAKREGWYVEEHTGLGGKRRVYALPERFNAEPRRSEREEGAPRLAIAAGRKADAELLGLAAQAVDEWCRETGRTLPPARKGTMINVLYDYMARGGEESDVKTLLQAIG